jgi:hypothetical protein
MKKNSCLPTQLFWPKKRRFTTKTHLGYFTAYFKALEKKQDLHLFFSKNDLLGPELFCDVFWIKFKQILSRCPSVSENLKKTRDYQPNCFGQKNVDLLPKPILVILVHILRRWRKNKICTFFSVKMIYWSQRFHVIFFG